MAVFDAIKRAQAGQFKGGTDVIATVKNGGVGIGKIERRGHEVRRPDQEGPGRHRLGQDQRHPRHGQVARSGVRSTRSRTPRNNEEVRSGRCQRPDRLRPAAGRGARPARRERGRQVHPDVDPLRAVQPGRGRDRGRRASRSRSTRPREAIDLGIGMVHQHFMLVPVMTVAENVVLGQEPTRGGAARRARGRAQGEGAVGALRPRRRSRARVIEQLSVGHAAAGRDPEDAVPRRPHPDPRRADRGAHRTGERRSSSRCCGRSRPTASRSSSSATS